VIVDIPSQEYTSASSAEIKDEATKKDVVEAQPGLIESTELAPLGDEKVAAGEGNVAAGQGELYNHPWDHGIGSSISQKAGLSFEDDTD